TRLKTNYQGSKWKNNSRRYTKKVKGQSQTFKFECPNLENEKEKDKKNLFFKKKKGLLETWDDLDLSSSKEENKEANLCLMADTTLEGEEDDEVDLKKDKFISHYSKYRMFEYLSYDCRDHPKGSFKPTRINKKEPKRI
ncbi:hypothetical protein CR513_05964, partial [Mucuna pruriens]